MFKVGDKVRYVFSGSDLDFEELMGIGSTAADMEFGDICTVNWVCEPNLEVDESIYVWHQNMFEKV